MKQFLFQLLQLSGDGMLILMNLKKLRKRLSSIQDLELKEPDDFSILEFQPSPVGRLPHKFNHVEK